MRHKCPVLTVKKLLKSVSIYGSYRKNKIGVPFFWNTLYVAKTIQTALYTFARNVLPLNNESDTRCDVKFHDLNAVGSLRRSNREKRSAADTSTCPWHVEVAAIMTLG